MQKLDRLVRRESTLRLGWNDFQFLNQTRVFDDYVDYLSADLWDREKMRGFVQRYREAGGNAYSLLDMFSKILTVDHWL
jgi:hypothetical protein